MSTVLDLGEATDIARRAAEAFGLRGPRVEFVKYRENYVFRLSGGVEDYALRIHRRHLHTSREIASEVALVRALGCSGLAVPRIVEALDGAVLVEVPDQDGDIHLVDMQEWIDGAAPLGSIEEAFLGTAALEPADFGRLGNVAADLHERLRRIDVPADFDRPAWDADGLLGPCGLWGDPMSLPLGGKDGADIRRAIGRLQGILRDASRDEQVFGIIHADFTPENILLRGDEMVVIDFDDAGYGWHAFDLATALFFFLPHPRYVEYEKALTGRYSASRAAGAQVVGLLEPMLFARGLTYLCWAAARQGDETAEFIASEVTPLVAGLARALLDQDADARPTSSARTPGVTTTEEDSQ